MKKGEIENIMLPESVINFLNYCIDIKGLAKGTVDGYTVDLKLFIKYIKLHKKDRRAINDKFIKTIELKHLYGFMTYLKDECDNNATTRSRKVATLKAYFGYLLNVARIITYDPTYELKAPKQPKTQPIALNFEQSKKLLESLNEDSATYFRDKCILFIFLHCGLRISELANIKLKDIKGNKLKIWGKGSKERYVYMSKPCLDTITDYLNVRNEEDVSEEDKQYLFISTHKTHIKQQAIRNMVEKYFGVAGLTDEHYTPHKLRSTHATLLNKAGANIRQIQMNLGHSSIRTTERYLRVEEKELEELANMNPLNNL